MRSSKKMSGFLQCSSGQQPIPLRLARFCPSIGIRLLWRMHSRQQDERQQGVKMAFWTRPLQSLQASEGGGTLFFPPSTLTSSFFIDKSSYTCGYFKSALKVRVVFRLNSSLLMRFFQRSLSGTPRPQCGLKSGSPLRGQSWMK